MNLAAFLSYVILTSITPGPNNIMSMTNAGRYGFRVFAGFIVVMAGCALFSSLLYEAVPAIEPYMLCAGAAYILWLAFHVWRSNAGPSETGDASNSFAAGAALQFVNVKVILYGITAFFSGLIVDRWGARPCYFLAAVFGFFCGRDISAVILWAGAAVGGVFMAVSRATKEAFGYGDSLLIGIMGMLLGFWNILSVLVTAFLLAALFSVILLFWNHFNRKASFPFIPFLTVAYAGGIFFGGY